MTWANSCWLIVAHAANPVLACPHRIQKNHFKRLDEEGKLPPPMTPPDTTRKLGPLDTVKEPEYLTTMMVRHRFPHI